MSLTTPILRSKDTNEPLESGEYIGILVRIIEKGTREEVYRATKKSYKRAKVLFTWVLPYHYTTIQQQSKPVLVHKEYTLSMWDKSPLYKDVIAIIGLDFKPDQHNQLFDLLTLGGCPARLKLVVKRQEKKEFIDVIEVRPLSEEDDIPDSPYAFSSLTFDEWDWAVFDSLNERTQNDIMATPEYQLVPLRSEEIPLKDQPDSDKPSGDITTRRSQQAVNPPDWRQMPVVSADD